jgi:amidase
VWPLAPSLDTIGPMAATVGGVKLGMELLEPGFVPSATAARVVGRVRTNGHPDIEAAIDAALRAAELEVVTLDWDGLDAGGQAFAAIYMAEMWDVDHALVKANPDDVGPDITQTVVAADLFRPGADEARRSLVGWRQSLSDLFGRVELLALPTLPVFPPRIDAIDADSLLPSIIEITSHVAPFNAAGTPGMAQPVPVPGNRLPASLQLVGPLGAEELLVTTAQRVEDAVRG